MLSTSSSAPVSMASQLAEAEEHERVFGGNDGYEIVNRENLFEQLHCQHINLLEGAPPPCLINMKEIWSSTLLSIGEDPSTQCSYWTPLYGDVFGVLQQDQLNYEDEPVDKTKHWGDFRFLEELPTHATRKVSVSVVIFAPSS
ncbi:hypothetical protein CQW23_10629 [Capsicum baccatum]|uniref:Uncharacterized protein n=1 Tax=Capsicum baccatum TaxID=33114 RepID=A0A2G2X069_CAPBA|nr:hypothetical protein CQW23_10629 [Capsicum baccatum]